MTIQTERLTLRPFTMRDLKTTHAYASDPENTPYMMNLPNKRRKETKQFLRSVIAEWEKDPPRRYEFAMIFNGKHIGAVSLHNIDESGRECELGWIIHKAHWNKGYATEAARAVMDFARGLGVTYFYAHCDARNGASFRVMEKLGMSLESETVGWGRYKHGPMEEARELKYSNVQEAVK